MIDGPQEVQWFVAKYEPDLMRAEPRNIGVILRGARGPLQYRFLTKSEAVERGGVRHPDVFEEWVRYWINTIEKHGVKCLYWLPKRRRGESHYIVLGGNRLATNGVNFDELFNALVGPAEDCGEPELKPGHWK